jgi:hypothetical protein
MRHVTRPHRTRERAPGTSGRRHAIRLAAVLGLLAATLLAAAPAGWADVVDPEIGNDKAGISVRVGAGGSSGGGGGGGGGVQCFWRPSVADDWYNAVHLGSPIIRPPVRDIDPPPEVKPWTYALLAPSGATLGTATWFVSFCGSETNFHWIDLVANEPAADVDALIRAARAELDPPEPEIGVSPANELVVNVPTWMWVDPATWNTEISVTASAGDGVAQIYQEATVTAKAVSLNFDMGDGTVVPCDGPGTRWTTAHDPAADSPSGCDHEYARASGGYPITANVVWELTWSAQGVAVNQGPTFLGTITTSNTVTRRVVEVQTLNR